MADRTRSTDNAGNTPEVGDYVAYNWSGNLATGYIVGVGKSKLSPIYQIDRILPEPEEGYYARGKRSVVRGGPKCVLVLQKGVTGEDTRFVKD